MSQSAASALHTASCWAGLRRVPLGRLCLVFFLVVRRARVSFFSTAAPFATASFSFSFFSCSGQSAASGSGGSAWACARCGAGGGEAERRGGRRAHAAAGGARSGARSGGAIIRPPSRLLRPHRSAVLRPPLVPVLGLGVGADALGAGGGLPAAAKRSGAVWEPPSGPQQRSAQVGTPWDSGSDGVGGARWAP